MSQGYNARQKQIIKRVTLGRQNMVALQSLDARSAGLWALLIRLSFLLAPVSNGFSPAPVSCATPMLWR
jgi:hypothetical protein